MLALRTGPGNFNRIWAAHPWDGGCLPWDVTLKDGSVWRGGRAVATLDEEGFFAEIGLPCWEPEERSAAKLGKWLMEQRGT